VLNNKSNLKNEKQKNSPPIYRIDKCIFFSAIGEIKPALATKALQEKIDASAKTLGFTTKFMQSGALHDSQNMSLIAPMAMIFVPSVGGISHSPKEFTKAIDMTNGANVLLNTILAVNKE
jgi:beta-ureidopropionase / N-carbamoyl-L-amino-acid hydrolase